MPRITQEMACTLQSENIMRNILSKINICFLVLSFSLSTVAQVDRRLTKNVTFFHKMEPKQIEDSPLWSNQPKLTALLSKSKTDSNATSMPLKKSIKTISPEGGIHGGGGNLVLINDGRRMLLDLFVNDVNFPFNGSADRMNIISTEPLMKLGVDRLPNEVFITRLQLNERIDAWRNTSPFFARLIQMAIEKISIYIFKGDIGFTDENYFIPDEKISEIRAIKTIAYYIEDYGFFLSSNQFESLDLNNQAAVIFHEALRHIQISYHLKLSNETLQILTAALITGPSPDQKSLDEKFEREFHIAKDTLLGSCMLYEILVNKNCANLDLHSNPTLSEILNFSDTLDKMATDLDQLVSDYMIPKTDRVTAEAVQNKFRQLAAHIRVSGIKNILIDSTDSRIALNKTLNMNAIDRIITDINEFGWMNSHYKKEALKLRKQLKEIGFFEVEK